MSRGLPANIPAATVQHLFALTHQVFSQAFLNAVRPTLAIAVAAILLGAFLSTFLRGGRSAAAARRVQAEVQIEGIPEAAS